MFGDLRALILILVLFYHEMIRDDKRVIESMDYLIDKTVDLEQGRVVDTETIAMVELDQQLINISQVVHVDYSPPLPGV